MKKFIYPALSIHNVPCTNVLTTSPASGADIAPGENVGGQPDPITGDAPSRLVEALNPHAEKPNALPH